MMKQAVGFANISKLGARGYVPPCIPLSPVEPGGKCFLDESIESKTQFASEALRYYRDGWVDGWMEGGKEGKPWFSNSSVRPAFHDTWNKQPLTGVRRWGDQKSKQQ